MNNLIKFTLCIILSWVPYGYGESFSSLPDDVQITLSPFAKKWNDISESKRQALLRVLTAGTV